MIRSPAATSTARDELARETLRAGVAAAYGGDRFRCGRVAGSSRWAGRWALLAMPAVLGLAVGCGKSQPSAEAPPPAAAAAPADEAPDDPAARGDEIDVEAIEAQLAGAVGGAAAGPAAPAPPPKRERPKDVAHWLPEDYRAAKAEGDLQLTKAVKYLVQRFSTDAPAETVAAEAAPAAETDSQPAPEPRPPLGEEPRLITLESLLGSPEPSAAPQPETSAEPVKDPQPARAPVAAAPAGPGIGSKEEAVAVLVEVVRAGPEGGRQQAFYDQAAVILRFLVGANVAAADEAVRQILAGTLPTLAGDRETTAWVVRDLAERLEPRWQELFLKLLVAPEEVRSSARVDVSASELQKLVWRAVEPKLTPQMRTELGAHVARASTPEAQRELFLPALRRRHVDNVPAQMTLYLSSVASAEMKQEFVQSFAKYNREALAALLGIPPLGDQPAVDRAAACRTVEQLWRGDWLSALALEVSLAESLAEANQLSGLVTALPVAPIRKALRSLVERNWRQGPPTVDGGLAKLLLDPGLLVLVKSLPRLEDPDVRKARLDRDRSQTAASSSARKRSVDDDDRARYAWMQTSEDLVRETAGRFFRAAQGSGAAGAGPAAAASGKGGPFRWAVYRQGQVDPGKADDEAAAEPAPQPVAVEGLPLALHPGAEVVAEYHLRWPDALAGEVQGVEILPLEIHYVRATCEDRLVKLGSYYQRQVKSGKGRVLADGRWIDFLELESEDLQSRSLDVLITTPPPDDAATASAEKPARKAVENEPLVVEVLAITIPRIE